MKTIEDEELSKVSGGVHALIDLGNHTFQCSNCQQIYKKFDHYPKGFFTGQKKDGCSAVNQFKCPGCGIEWTE